MKLSANYSRYDDERLISLIAQSQEKALAQLFEHYSRLVFGLALMIVRDSATAEDITLDVCMRVWQKAGSYDPAQAKVSTWLTSITRNHAIDVLHSQAVKKDKCTLGLDQLISLATLPEDDPQETVELSLRREWIYAALAQLPTNQQQAIILAYFGGYTQRQIAEMLEQPIGTIKTRLRLAMQKLRDYLNEEQEPKDKSIKVSTMYNFMEEDLQHKGR